MLDNIVDDAMTGHDWMRIALLGAECRHSMKCWVVNVVRWKGRVAAVRTMMDSPEALYKQTQCIGVSSYSSGKA